MSLRRRLLTVVGGFGAVALLVLIWAPTVGSTSIDLARVFDTSIPWADNVDAQIFFVARLPRVLAGALIGATLAAAGVVLSGLLDNVDGAVAVLTGRATAWGQVLDSVADRVGDLVFLGLLLAAGAPLPVCAAAGAVTLLQEYLRARAAASGMTEVGVVTVWERPTRVIVTAAFLASAAALGSPWPTLAAWVWVGLGVVGLGQLAVGVRRRLG